MVRIREVDYHHGAFVANLVNKGFHIELLESVEARRSYRIANGLERYLVYSKFASSPSSQNNYDGATTWTFYFAEEEIEKIKSYQKQDNSCLIALAAHYGRRDGGELAVLTVGELFRCIGEGWRRRNAKVSVLKVPRNQVKIYGTGIDRTQAFIARTRLYN